MTAIQIPFRDVHHQPEMESQVVYRSSPKRKRGPDLDLATTTSNITSSISTTTSSKITTSGLRRADELEMDDSVDGVSPSTSTASRVTGRFQRLRLQSPAAIEGVGGQTLHVLAGSDSSDYNVRNQTTVPESPQPTSFSSSPPSPTPEITPLQASVFTFQSNPAIPPTIPQHPTSSLPELDLGSEQFWQESEITGWSPDDPDEDNYGVNGVGYHKTPALAYSLSQKRKRQIADYRSRETKEARQRRGERRLRLEKTSPRLGSGSVDGSGSPPLRDGKESGKKVTRSVRFEDG